MKCDPRRTFDVWLSCFDDVPAAERPVLVYRRTTADEWERISDALDGTDETVDVESAATLDSAWGKRWRERCYEAALIGLVGARNQIDPSNGEPVTRIETVKDLRRVVNPRELVELLSLRLRGGQLTPEEKKPSASPS